MPAATSDTAPAPSPRRKPRPGIHPSAPAGRRGTVQRLLVFVTAVLVINGLVGERGLMETLRVRKQHQELLASIERQEAERVRLEDEVRRLQSDPATIEALARQELGLIRPGEILFIIKDARPAPAATR
jgi:cell division protein FtsB